MSQIPLHAVMTSPPEKRGTSGPRSPQKLGKGYRPAPKRSTCVPPGHNPRNVLGGEQRWAPVPIQGQRPDLRDNALESLTGRAAFVAVALPDV